MGYKQFSIKMPTDYTFAMLKQEIKKRLGISDFTVQIENKSLDARKKTDIHWLIRVGVFSDELKGEVPVAAPSLEIPYQKRDKKVIVVGSGPAGFFAAFVLQKAGFDTTIIERGADVDRRSEAISTFEETGIFNPAGTYAFGEGGAGTFTDGKLTSRSKHISAERQFILSSYISAGAPKEIAFLAHPHLGSDYLKIIVKKLRQQFIEIGGSVIFDTMLEDLKIKNGRAVDAVTSGGILQADEFIIASGHSAFETYRMLIRNGVNFRTKNFAIGSRVEHRQGMINRAQWGRKKLHGVKSAEYRLSSKRDGFLPVFTFCMCPGGTIVPATPYENTNIVNGMSLYLRKEKFANAGCVVGVHPNDFAGKEVTASEALDVLENIERSFFDYSGGFEAPFCGIQDFIEKKEAAGKVETSYPLGLRPAPLWNLLPEIISISLREGLKDFSRKIKGFEKGNIMGLESKTSSPIQVVREKDGLCAGFENLYIAGEGSGYAGGIITSGADGIKAAMNVIRKYS